MATYVTSKLGFNTGYNYDRADVSRETGFSNPVDADGVAMPSMTKQSFAEECDINTIVKRFGITGEMPPTAPPSSVEFNEVFDFQSAMNVIRAGEESFASLDADLRAKFNNSPALFLDFVHNEDNRAQAELWGMVPRKAPLAVDPPKGDDKPVVGVPDKP